MRRDYSKAGITLLALLGIVGTARAGNVLALDGNFNHTTINFSDPSGTHSVAGGGTIGGTLDGQPLTALYCYSVIFYERFPGPVRIVGYEPDLHA